MMQMINMLFLKIVERSLTAGIVIAVVLSVRMLIRRLPKSFAYALWLVVAFRLAVPFTAGSDISIFNAFTDGRIRSEIRNSADGTGIMADADSLDSLIGQTGAGSAQDGAGNAERTVADWIKVMGVASAVSADGNDALSPSSGEFPDDPGTMENSPGVNRAPAIVRDSGLIRILAVVWIAGILILAFYTVAARLRIGRKIRYSVRLCGNVYECDMIRSPFVLGVTAPKIYLPFRLNAVQQQCILAHERYHIRRKDYLVKSFAYLLAVIYWFQPLVWVAYRLMCIDMEMSCDEKVISGFTVELRKEYSRLLLAFAVNRRQLSASPLAFGEENIMKRINNIIHYKKTSRWKLAVGAAAIVLTMAACATDASEDEAPTVQLDMENATAVSENGGADTAVTMSDVTVDHDTDPQHQGGQVPQAIGHREAQWAENTMFDIGYASLDYADSERIVFHIASGLFAYDLQERKIVRSLDLRGLGCRAIGITKKQMEGDCGVEVYQDSDGRLRAAITPYLDAEGSGYVYDIESDELFAYDESLLDEYILFDEFVSKYDLKDEKAFHTWKVAANVLPLGGHSYGVLFWEQIDLVTMYYKAGEEEYRLFQEEQATLPRLLKQDDGFYESMVRMAGEDINQCVMDYTGIYALHDYAGVCAFTRGLVYTDEMQREFARQTDFLSADEEVSHSEDGKEYLFCFTRSDDYGAEGEKVYVRFRYVEGEGWRAEGLPAAEP